MFAALAPVKKNVLVFLFLVNRGPIRVKGLWWISRNLQIGDLSP